MPVELSLSDQEGDTWSKTTTVISLSLNWAVHIKQLGPRCITMLNNQYDTVLDLSPLLNQHLHICSSVLAFLLASSPAPRRSMLLLPSFGHHQGSKLGLQLFHYVGPWCLIPISTLVVSELTALNTTPMSTSCVAPIGKDIRVKRRGLCY